MLTLSEAEVLSRIETGETFSAELDDGSLRITIQEYLPYLCTAIHAGHQLRPELEQRCLLDDSERLREEDPWTDEFIDSFPITLVAHDSRYEYDLNRDEHNCIYTTAWEQRIWRREPTKTQQRHSVEKHRRYYRILHALVSAISSRFGNCLLIDVHSYNWKVRPYPQAPVFNIGTAQIDLHRWGRLISLFEKSLRAITLPNLDTDVKRDTVFKGLGYQAHYVKAHFPNALTVPLEVKKVYMDEESGERYPLVLEQLQQGLHHAILDVAAAFSRRIGKTKLKPENLVASNLDLVAVKVDRALFKLAKSIDTLHYVNPINLQQEKRRFLGRRGYEPGFHYRQLRLDPFEFREKLYKLPVSEISDPPLRELYRQVVDSFATKIELLSTVGTPQFLYNSLRYYGEPSPNDKANAEFLLHATELPNQVVEAKSITAQEAKHRFEETAERLGYPCRVQLSSRIVAKAMVDNNRRALLINKSAFLSPTEFNALVEHELGVHMATTLNARAQPLKVLTLGLPGNTYTQEGLAILAEYYSGNINLQRLKFLGLRVLAVEMMCSGMSFHVVYSRLTNEHGLNADQAFNLTTRVFRGGGFTKDFLYLKGFHDMLLLARSRDIASLFTGKTSSRFIDTLDGLLAREILKPPQHKPRLLNEIHQLAENPIMDYLVSCIRG